MEARKMKWEDPKLLELDALPEALGHCNSGSSASPESGGCVTGTIVTEGDGSQSCHTGEMTSGAGGGHDCVSGGVAGGAFGGCNTGSSVQ